MRTERNATYRPKPEDVDKLLREAVWDIVEELEILNENMRMISQQLGHIAEKL